MSKIGPILPNKASESAAARGRAIVLLDKILQVMLLGATTIVFTGFLVYLPRAASNIFATIASFAILAALTFLVIYRDLRYETRAAIAMLGFFLVAYLLYRQSGFGIITIPVVFAMFYFSGFFLGWKGLCVSLICWAAAVAMYVWMSPAHLDVLMFSTPNLDNAGKWILTISTLLITAGSIIGSQIALASNFRTSLEQGEEIAAELSRAQNSIEQQLQERTLYYQRHLLQGRVAAEISGSISSILNQQQLLQTVADLMKDRFDLYYVGVFVLDAERKFAVLRAGTGEAGKKMLAAHHSLPVGGSSMIGWSVLNRQPRIALDTGAEAIRFNNPYLPQTRSELALPIIAKGEALGALSVQSTQPNAFDEDDIAILQGIADSLGATLENARLYQQTENALNEVRAISNEFITASWSATVKEYGGLEYQFEDPLVTLKEEGSATHEFPLLLRDQVIGYLTVENDAAELTPDEIAFAEAFTQQTAVALENARLLEETQRHAREEQKLNELSEQFSSARSIEEILRSAVTGLGKLPSVDEVSIHLVAPEPEAYVSNSGHNGNGHNGHNGHNGNGHKG